MDIWSVLFFLLAAWLGYSVIRMLHIAGSPAA